LLYANKLFSKSPIILTQLGNSYFELNDYAKAELYLKEALKINPEFGQAHSSLCDLYIKQNRLKDAILELFAGVKGMGCSYNQASNNYSYLLQQSQNSGGQNNKTSGQDFWDVARKQLDPPDALAPLVPEDARVKMPDFPDCKKVEDWLEGGGLNNAVQSFQGFHDYQMSFVSEHLEIREQKPDLPPKAVLRDYPNERLAIDCITEMFFAKAKQNEQEYRENIDKITQRVNDAKDSYLKNLLAYTKRADECYKGCSGDQWCVDECHRVFCKEECPNANNFNDLLRRSYIDWFTEFYKLVKSQKLILDDLYGFSNPWLAKISSPYLSRMYAYEIKSVALSIVGNCFAAYPQTFQGLSHNDCGTDCAIYAKPAPHKPDELNKKSPEGNQCPLAFKFKLSFGVGDLAMDCESIEFAFAEGVAASVKHNFVKKTTTAFLGVGYKGDTPFISAGILGGMQVTVSDDNQIKDAGFKFDVSVSAGVGPVKTGSSLSSSFTIMTGFGSKITTSAGAKAE
jgi:tetratricopeptide (TPR) repeat protein